MAKPSVFLVFRLTQQIHVRTEKANINLLHLPFDLSTMVSCPLRRPAVTLILLLTICSQCDSFTPVTRILSLPAISQQQITDRSKPCLASTTKSNESNNSKYVKKKQVTIKELQQEMIQNPAKFQQLGESQVKKKSSRRTRQRTENPSQQYLYKSQRQALDKKQLPKKQSVITAENNNGNSTTTLSIEQDGDATFKSPLAQAHEFGLLTASQHCDAAMDAVEPRVVARIRVSDETGSSSSSSSSAAYAYFIEKPAGWSILGANKKVVDVEQLPSDREAPPNVTVTTTTGTKQPNDSRHKFQRTVRGVDDDGSTEFIEYNILDVLALLSPEEQEEYLQELKEEGVALPSTNSKTNARRLVGTDSHLEDDDYEDEKEQESTSSATASPRKVDQNPLTAENWKRIAARAVTDSLATATFANNPRPSVVSWFKDHKAAEGTPIRGGNFWIGLAGATDVDDSGLVLLCPRKHADNLAIEYAEYIAVVGNGKYLAPKQKTAASEETTFTLDGIAKLRKNRADDAVQTVNVHVAGALSTCSSVVDPCQSQFQDGIRGDPVANPFDRRAPRRLIHCKTLSASSLTHDETVTFNLEDMPDDIALLSDRNHKAQFKYGSAVSRSSLEQNPLTNAYREINGAADGFPGWTVDRYDKWLLVQHDPNTDKGPLPSIHDGNTAGVYYLESSPGRGADDAKPRLFEGQPAPDGLFPILENGVQYLVSLDNLSTGIFLDQRPQRAWLTRNCCSDTRILNCFAHTGAFSVAAASAGASTVSLDLSRKWLDRLPKQFEANNIPFDELHDCIYGDCFDWLARLAKRGEKYDIVILDPPSTSVGGKKKKRWSVRNDMDELVSLAAGLVKPGGLLWTTTNSATIHPVKFARSCKNGFELAGIDCKLERLQPMPFDFPSIGAQPVKNLVWRIPN
jgi:23S rRNA (cytosine1962-C5)-methyltransferase